MYCNKAILMKKYSALFLSVLVATASVTAGENHSATVALPTFVVEAERSSAAERHLNRSLDALRALARVPVAISVDLPALKAHVGVDAKALSGARLAKI